MKRHVLSAMAVMCSQAAMETSPVAVVAVGSAGAGGVLLRGNRGLDSKRRPLNARAATPGNARARRLEDSDSDSDSDSGDSEDDDSEDDDSEDDDSEDDDSADDGEEDGDDEESYDADGDDAGWDDAARQYQDDDVAEQQQYDDDSTLGTIVRNFNTWEQEAESSVWAFYELPPSEWTPEQCNQFFGLLVGLCLTLCLGAGCCAYHFVQDQDEGKDTDTGSRAKKWTPKKASRGRKAKNWSEFADDEYKRYQDELGGKDRDSEGEDDVTVETETMDGGAPSTVGPQSTAQSVSTVAYEPPRTTSLAEYTSAQREKEARIWEAWKASRVRLESDKIQHEYDDWKEEYDNKYVVRTNVWNKKLNASLELDVALEEKRRGGDRLLEAREFQHNLVGYYL